jgi:3-oxoadipate enol-lactonase
MSKDPIDHGLQQEFDHQFDQAFDQAFERGMRNRRRILGDAWVERSLEKSNSFTADFQNLITRYAWNDIWGRPGLDAKTRRVIVIATTMALSRWEEFELHVRAAVAPGASDSLTPDELKEVLMQGAIYAGVPAANTGFALAQPILREAGHILDAAKPAHSSHPGIGREACAQNGLRYSVRAPRSGKAPRRTVVLAHALGCDMAMWDELANTLAADCRVICYDQRGHGGSSAPPGPYTIAGLADDAAALLRELDSGPVLWVGLSMGGMVGQELALRHPSLVAALVIANSTSSYADEARAMWQARIAAVREGGTEAVADAVIARYFHDAFRKEQPATVARFRRRLASTGRDGYIACCHAVAGVDTTARLPSIAVPVLVIAGAIDAGTPPAMSEAMADAITGARLHVLADASHLSAIEQPQAFAAAVIEFCGAT